MVFSSIAFLFIFFPIVFVLYFAIRNDFLRNVLLIIASLVFYAYGEPEAVVIMLISILVNYICGLMCGEAFFRGHERQSQACRVVKKCGLAISAVLNIGLLFVFKYADFFLENIGLSDRKLGLALPIGISFFTFQGLSYVIDVYRDRKCLQRDPLAVMLYISFFPQLIAGPIVKYHDIKEQLVRREFNIDRVSRGICRFIFGLGKKMLIAGPMGLMADTVYAMDVSGIGVASAWLAAVSYAFQIYFDFSGYSDMAIGLGCIFGFDFKENFNKPYMAAGMQDFWRRWHISLSTWFRDYVYIPMGGNRKGQVRTYINKFTVFILTGLWHGANWTFVCWGLMHGTALILEDLVKKAFMKGKEELTGWKKVLSQTLGHMYALFFIVITFVVFRADNLSYAVRMIVRLFAGSGSNAEAFALLTPTYLIALVMAVIFASDIPDRVMTKAKGWMLGAFSAVVYAASLIMLVSGGYNPFIYFRF